jgi:phenylalanyl-tRNA synthetase beta chain
MIITKNYFLKNNFQEIITSPLKNPLLKKLKNISSFLIPLKNPLNLEFSHLRSTIVESLIFQLEKGRYLKNDHGIKIFETGRIFYQEHINKKKKIFEEEHLGAIFELSPKSINFKSEKEKAINKKYWFLAKSFLENYLKIFGQENIFMLKGIFDKKLEKFYHPEKSITIFKNKTIFGTFGEIHPIFNKKFKNTTFLLELNMSLLKDLNIFSKVPIFQEFSKYPLISRDISFRISKEKNFLIIPSILKNKIPLIKSCIYYDFFFNSNDQDKISASLRIKFQNDKRTLVTSEIDEILEIIYSILREKFEVEI